MQKTLSLYSSGQLTYVDFIKKLEKSFTDKTLSLEQALYATEQWIKECKPYSAIAAYVLSDILQLNRSNDYQQASYILQEPGTLILSSYGILRNFQDYNPDLIISLMDKGFTAFPEISKRIRHIILNINDDGERETYEIYKRCINEFADLIQEYLQNGKTVIVHCVAGISRSPTLVLHYLIRHKKMNCIAAIKFLNEKRNCISPNGNFLKLLLDLNKI